MDRMQTAPDISFLVAAAGFLSSAQENAASDSSEAKLFAELLSQNKYAPKEQGRQNDAPSALDNANKNSMQASVKTSAVAILPSLKSLGAAWRSVVHQLHMLATAKTKPPVVQAHVAAQAKPVNEPASVKVAKKSEPAPQSAPAVTQQADDAKPVQDQASEYQTASTQVPPVASSSVSDEDNIADASDAQSTTGDEPVKTLADLLAELQLIGLLMMRQLQAAAQDKGNSAQPAVGNADLQLSSDLDASQLAAAAMPGPQEDLLQSIKDFMRDLRKSGFTGFLQDAAQTTSAADTQGTSVSSEILSPDDAQKLEDLLGAATAIAKTLEDTSAEAGTPEAPAVSAPQSNAPNLLLTMAEKSAAVEGGVTKGAAPEGQPVSAQTMPKPEDAARFMAVSGENLKTNAAASVKAAAGARQETNIGVSQKSSHNQSTASTASIAVATEPVVADDGAQGGAFEAGRGGQNSLSYSASSSGQNPGAVLAIEGRSAASPYSFANQLASTKAGASAITGLPPAVEQVMLQINRNVKSGTDQMTLQLNPAELGRVSIKLEIAPDGKVQGTIVASNPSTLDTLLKDVRSLERALQEAGLRADPGSLQFSLGGQAGQSFAQSANEFGRKDGKGSQHANAEVASVSDQTEIYYLTPGRVNMRV